MTALSCELLAPSVAAADVRVLEVMAFELEPCLATTGWVVDCARAKKNSASNFGCLTDKYPKIFKILKITKAGEDGSEVAPLPELPWRLLVGGDNGVRLGIEEESPTESGRRKLATGMWSSGLALNKRLGSWDCCARSVSV
jgi:hypothetical protein